MRIYPLIPVSFAVLYVYFVVRSTILVKMSNFKLSGRANVPSNHLTHKGFTIIEVMIVLAIAAVIILIVFLAVPALQRNSRNVQLKREATRILAGANEWVANANGVLPSGATAITCSGTGGGAANCDLTASPNNAMQIWQNANKPQNILGLTIAIQNSTTAVTPGLTAATLVTGVTCPTLASGATSVTPVAGPSKSIILIFAIEKNDGNPVAQCLAS